MDKYGMSESMKKALEHYERFRNLVDPPYLRALRSSSTYCAMGAKGILDFTILRALGSASEMVNSLALSQIDYAKTFNSMAGLPASWKDYSKLLNNKELGIKAMQGMVADHSSAIIKTMQLSERIAFGMDWDRLGFNIGLNANLSNKLLSSYDGMLSSYNDFFSEVRDTPEELLSVDPILTLRSSQELLNETNMLRVITPAIDDEEDEDSFDFIEALAEDAHKSVSEILVPYNSDLGLRYMGARKSLQADNPDKARHVCTSLRELLINYLDVLSPDEEVRNWTNDPDYFISSNKASRKAKMFFLCRNIDSVKFKELMNKDIDSILQLFHFFNTGTHGETAVFNDTELTVFLIRAECAIRTLYEISKHN